MKDLGQIEGYEHAPYWWIEQENAKEFEKFLISSGYYKSFEKVTLLEVAA